MPSHNYCAESANYLRGEYIMMSKEEVCAAIPFYLADNKMSAVDLA